MDEFFPEFDIHSSCLIAMVLRDVRVWHYSGTDDTQPWMFLDCVNAAAVKFFAARVWFAHVTLVVFSRPPWQSGVRLWTI